MANNNSNSFHPRQIDLTGQRFTRLRVIALHAYTKYRESLWSCMCDCGNTVIVCSNSLRRGHTRSCGCLAKELRTQRLMKHGMSYSQTYKSWSNMKDRCQRPNNSAYERYGGRGITVCNKWQTFEGFLADMDIAPPDHEIDRIDNNLGYFKENCRWATVKVQANNHRNNHLITYEGKTHTLAEWADILGLPYKTLWSRIGQRRWPLNRALTSHRR